MKKKGKKKQTGRKMTLIWIVFIAVFISELFFNTWCRVQYVRVGYEISQEAERRERITTLQKNLRIELARLKSPDRISKIAKEELGLIIPDPDQIVIIK
ncbi:MAG: hypothetical protein HN737_01295 [Desulfobacterales bacterium]|jgi:cell division protein FtsL|nr:hypothetical protein [Desulfobacteraceae bacterium]MBT4363518.1 hypothetical protein [Desulfobacteraceae bacterium]MBT7085258.1 hypothetical protein [Desulfobacterales bacterium]MBT7696026.1 hypothetical protein [Desulfobacterales bacterium]